MYGYMGVCDLPGGQNHGKLINVCRIPNPKCFESKSEIKPQHWKSSPKLPPTKKPM